MTPELPLKQVRALAWTVDFIEVSWVIDPTTIDVWAYTFQVFRSESPEGPYEAVSEPFEDRYVFIDNSVKTLHRYRNLYYRVRVTAKTDGSTWEYGPADIGQETDLVAGEIRSHILMLMNEFIGERCWILPARTFGMRCPACWNDTLKKKTKSGCRTCWETGFARGYLNPIETWVSIDPSTNAEQQTEVGKIHQNDTTARTGYYPPLKPQDLLVSPTLTRWRITQVNQTKHVGSAVHQELQLHELPPTALEYAIVINTGQALRTLALKPPRTFTNPQQLATGDRKPWSDPFTIFTGPVR